MTNDQSTTLHFLVAVDGSEHSFAAVRWAAHIASTGLPLRCTVLNVQRPIMSGEVSLIAPASIAQEERDRSAVVILEDAAARLRLFGVQVEMDEELDDAATAVVERAGALGCDAIIIGRRGLGVLRSILLGSVSSKVIERSGVPVVVVGDLNTPGGEPAPLRLLVALDGSDSAQRAAAFAARLADAAHSHVQLMHVEPTMTVAGSVLGSREKVIERWSGKHAEQAFAKVRGLFTRTGLTCTELVVSSDDPPDAILKAAQDHSCSIIAMGTRGLSPVTGLLLGSVAQRVLDQARDSAAVVLVH